MKAEAFSMHKFARAAGMLCWIGAFATPAAAQYFPPPQNWGFGYELFGQIRFLKARIAKVEQRIDEMDRRHQITGRSVDRFREEANAIQRHLRNDAAYGLTIEQANAMEGRIIRLEQRVEAAFAERERRLGNAHAYPSDDWRRDADQDRDRNGRDDRWEDDWQLTR